MSLNNKVAIVTGSAGGIGKAYAQRLAQDGAAVTVCDVLDCSETAAQIERMGGKALALKTDVSNEQSTVEMAKKTVDQFGRIDILVNNAAYYGNVKKKAFNDIEEEEWDSLMAVNLKGVWLCCKAVFPFMREIGRGKIINISSGVHFGGIPFFLHYVASKGGVVALTRALAREVGQYNITVNAVAPGLTMTKAGQTVNPPDRVAQVVESQSIKRPEQPEDLVGTVLFLASEDSDFITGQTFVVDGGVCMH
jgi:NAD(P)-dependent dehydrogenase (short-subunit alcohol dehydrogenase family)